MNTIRMAGRSIVIAGCCMVFAGFAVFGYQWYLSLRDGEWFSLPLLDTLFHVGVIGNSAVVTLTSVIKGIEWLELRRVIFRILLVIANAPVSGSLIVLGLALSALGTGLGGLGAPPATGGRSPAISRDQGNLKYAPVVHAYDLHYYGARVKRRLRIAINSLISAVAALVRR